MINVANVTRKLILMIAILLMDKTATPKWLCLPLFKQRFSSICVTTLHAIFPIKKKKLDPICPSFWPIICLVLQKPQTAVVQFRYTPLPTHKKKANILKTQTIFDPSAICPSFLYLISNRVRSVFFTFKKKENNTTQISSNFIQHYVIRT